MSSQNASRFSEKTKGLRQLKRAKGYKNGKCSKKQKKETCEISQKEDADFQREVREYASNFARVTSDSNSDIITLYYKQIFRDWKSTAQLEQVVENQDTSDSRNIADALNKMFRASPSPAPQEDTKTRDISGTTLEDLLNSIISGVEPVNIVVSPITAQSTEVLEPKEIKMEIDSQKPSSPTPLPDYGVVQRGCSEVLRALKPPGFSFLAPAKPTENGNEDKLGHNFENLRNSLNNIFSQDKAADKEVVNANRNRVNQRVLSQTPLPDYGLVQQGFHEVLRSLGQAGFSDDETTVANETLILVPSSCPSSSSLFSAHNRVASEVPSTSSSKSSSTQPLPDNKLEHKRSEDKATTEVTNGSPSFEPRPCSSSSLFEARNELASQTPSTSSSKSSSTMSLPDHSVPQSSDIVTSQGRAAPSDDVATPESADGDSSPYSSPDIVLTSQNGSNGSPSACSSSPSSRFAAPFSSNRDSCEAQLRRDLYDDSLNIPSTSSVPPQQAAYGVHFLWDELNNERIIPKDRILSTLLTDAIHAPNSEMISRLASIIRLKDDGEEHFLRKNSFSTSSMLCICALLMFHKTSDAPVKCAQIAGVGMKMARYLGLKKIEEHLKLYDTKFRKRNHAVSFKIARFVLRLMAALHTAGINETLVAAKIRIDYAVWHKSLPTKRLMGMLQEKIGITFRGKFSALNENMKAIMEETEDDEQSNLIHLQSGVKTFHHLVSMYSSESLELNESVGLWRPLWLVEWINSGMEMRETNKEPIIEGCKLRVPIDIVELGLQLLIVMCTKRHGLVI